MRLTSAGTTETGSLVTLRVLSPSVLGQWEIIAEGAGMSGQDDSPRRPADGTAPAETVRLPRQTGRPDAVAASGGGETGTTDEAGVGTTARKGDGMRSDDATRRTGGTAAGPEARGVRAAPGDSRRNRDQPIQDQPIQDQRSLGQLVASASRDLSTLVRDEIALAKAELKESVTAAGIGAGLFGAAAFLGYVAFLMLSIAAGYGLVAAGLHPAVSFLIVAGAYLLIAGIIAYVGMRKLRKAGPPKRTIQSIEEAKAIVARGNHK
jgi:Putative Actinobacterial Holin-X, holin superfamily III